MPELGLENIRAKVDTGATTSSLYATHVQVMEKEGKEFARFRVHFGLRGNRTFRVAEAPLISFRTVRSSSGDAEDRPVIKTKVCALGRCWTTEITLTSRRMMEYPMLLGRSFLSRRFVVDPSRSFLSESDKPS